MTKNVSLPQTLKSMVDERLAAQKRRVAGMSSELKPRVSYFGGPGGGEHADGDNGGLRRSRVGPSADALRN